jgi:catechol 2,3-dioxygenase-like lactoylglutathione lyase family enzyme
LFKTARLSPPTFTGMSNLISVTLSTSDPRRLAAFYQRATGYRTIYDSVDSVYLAGADGMRLGFDRVEGFQPPAWSSQQLPAMRLDLAGDKLDQTEAQMLALGATRPGHARDTDRWIFLADPEGHAFCVTSVY